MDKSIAGVFIIVAIVSRWYPCVASPERDLENELLVDYERHDPPSSNSSTEVKIGVYFNSFQVLDENGRMHFSGNFYLRQNWKDPRLQFKPARLNGKKEFRLSDSAQDKIWRPDIFFRNGFDVKQQQVIRDNVLLKLNSSGFVWYVVKMTATFYCPMKLHKYPFDTQTCPIMFESFGHTMDELYLSWQNSPIQLDTAIRLPKYTLEEKILYDCSQNYTAGSFPCLEARLVLRRDSGYFFIQAFLPTMLLVIMSWFVLWLNIQDFSHRLGLAFLLIVCLILMHSLLGNQVSQVSYVKAIDVWMFMSLMFIFAVLIESIVVKVIYTRSYRTTEHVNLDDPSVKRVHDNRVTRLIDLVSRVAFPLVYLLAIIIFFGLYAS